MRRVLKEVFPLLTVRFLLSVVTPEPDYLQGHQSAAGPPTFVATDATFALCTNLTVVVEGQHRTERLLPVVQAYVGPST